jgi:hypothetical protein
MKYYQSIKKNFRRQTKIPTKKKKNDTNPTSQPQLGKSTIIFSVSGRQFIYPPTEKIPVIQVEIFHARSIDRPRFLEWLQIIQWSNRLCNR